MDFQMKTDMWVEFQKEIQELFGSLRVEIERTVEYTDIWDTVTVDDLQSFADGIDGKYTNGFLASAYTKGTSVETSPSCFQLDKRHLFSLDHLNI